MEALQSTNTNESVNEEMEELYDDFERGSGNKWRKKMLKKHTHISKWRRKMGKKFAKKS